MKNYFQHYQALNWGKLIFIFYIKTVKKQLPNLNLSPEKEREQFVNEQQTRANARNKLRTYPERWLGRNKVNYVAVAQEEAQKMDDLAKLKVLRGESTSYQEAIEDLMHLEDFQLKDEKKVITEENWKNLPAEATYSKSENSKTDIPVFLMPGWASTPGITFKDCIKKLNSKGRDVLSVESTRTMEILATKEEKHPIVEIQKAMVILKVLEEKGIKKTDMLLHSEASINGLIAASMAPEKFRKIIMAMPVGIISKDSFWELAGRFSKEMFAGAINMIKDPKKIKPTNIYLLDFFRYIAKNPMLALKEVLAISESDMSYLVKNLEEQGIQIEILAASNDQVSTSKRIKENNPDLSINEIEGAHGEIFMDAEKSINKVDELLDKK